MKHLINKGLLLLSAFVVIYMQHTVTDTRLITALLLSLIASVVYPALYGIAAADRDIPDVVKSSNRIYPYLCEGLVCMYLISAFPLQPVYMLVSIVSYDMYRYRQRLSPAILVLLSIYMCVTQPLMTFLPQICLIAFSFAMSIYCCHMDLLRKELFAMRDNTAEHDMLMAQNTRQLLENQDNMVLNATLSERNRIAREIHDNVGHMLTRSILQTGAIKVINKDERLEKPLAQLQSTLDTAMDSMRKSVHDLHDESIDLRTALDDVIKNVQGIDIHMDYDMSDKLPREIKYSFINIVKEAINNTLKHSNGDRMDIRVREHPAFYQLYISDNGHSIRSGIFPENNRFSGGMGLYGIQERVNKLGGTMKITATDGFAILINIMKKDMTD